MLISIVIRDNTMIFSLPYYVINTSGDLEFIFVGESTFCLANKANI